MRKSKEILHLTPWVFILSLLCGQLVRIPVLTGYIFPHDIALAVSLCIGFLVNVKIKIKIPKKILTPCILFISAIILSIIVQIPSKGTEAALIGSMYLARLVYYVIGGFVLVKLYKTFPWKQSLYVLGTGLSVIGLIQYALYPDLRNLQYLGWDPHYYRLFSTLLDPNFTGIMLVLTILLGIQFVLSKSTWMSVGLLLLNVIALILTFSRSSYIAFIGAIIVFSAMTKRWKLLIGFFAISLIVSILLQIIPHASLFSLTRFNSGIARVDNWALSMEYIRTAPILGNGWYMLKDVGEATRAFSLLDNSFLFVAASTGVVGLSIFLWLSGTILHRIYKRRRDKENLTRAVIVAFCVATVIHSQFVNSLFYPWVILWIIVLLTSDT